MKNIKEAARKCLETVFPMEIYCMCCGSIIDASREYALCDNCIDKLHWAGGKTCAKCGKILEENYRHDMCADCREREHYFDRGFTCAQYGLYERALVMDLKYRDKSWIGRKLGMIMAERISLEDVCVDMAVPVPVHPQRMYERGYNQAEIMARPVAERLGVRLDTCILKRKRETAAMKDLGVWERIENTRDAFEVVPGRQDDLQGKKIILIDDIYTTGATMDGCSRVLKEAGAAAVYAFTFAAGGNRLRTDEDSR